MSSRGCRQFPYERSGWQPAIQTPSPKWGSGGRGFKSRRPDFFLRETPQRFTAVAFFASPASGRVCIEFHAAPRPCTMVSRTSLDIQRRRARSRALRDKSCQNAKGYESHSLGRSTFLTPRPSSEGDSWRTWSPTRRYVASASATPLAKRYQPWSSPCHTST